MFTIFFLAFWVGLQGQEPRVSQWRRNCSAVLNAMLCSKFRILPTITPFNFLFLLFTLKGLRFTTSVWKWRRRANGVRWAEESIFPLRVLGN